MNICLIRQPGLNLQAQQSQNSAWAKCIGLIKANGSNLKTILVLDAFDDEHKNLNSVDDKNEDIDKISKKIPESEDIYIEKPRFNSLNTSYEI